MHLRCPVFPSPAVTTTNQLNVATTCQSSTCTSSGFGQPVNTSVQANPSIRAIRPNLVKSRAQEFEKKDSDVRKELLPAKTVVGGNSRFRTNASPVSVTVTVESRHSAVQQSKSDGHLEHTGVSRLPSVRPTDRSTKFTFNMDESSECQNPPSSVHRSLRHASSDDGRTHSETSSDIVAQRLQMFENKPVMSSKPPRLPKPSSPYVDSGANRVSVCCSRSDSVNKSSDISNLHADDVKKSAARQVKETVVVSPTLSGQVNETGVATSPQLPAFTESSRIHLPKPSQKRQVREMVVLNPSSASGQVNETGVANQPPSPSVTESSKILLAKPPQKPPRMAVVSADPAPPAHDDSYGLLVSAAGPCPSIHVEKLSPDVDAPPEPPRRKMSAKRVADVCSRLESHSNGNPTCRVPVSVLNTSRIQNVASQSSSVADAWDQKFIRAPKTTPVVSSRGEKENFVSKKRMNNPSYMYVSMHTDDIIPSQKKIGAEKHTALTRHHSDDMLNKPPAPSLANPKSPGYNQPLYAVPFDAGYNADQIVFDSEGYAVPHVPNSPQFKVTGYCYIAVTFYGVCKVFFRI